MRRRTKTKKYVFAPHGATNGRPIRKRSSGYKVSNLHKKNVLRSFMRRRTKTKKYVFAPHGATNGRPSLITNEVYVDRYSHRKTKCHIRHPELVVSIETRDLTVVMLKLVQHDALIRLGGQHDVLRNRSSCFALAIKEVV